MSQSPNWSKELSQAQHQSAALALGIFTRAGEILHANRGMQLILGGHDGDNGSCEYFVNPDFRQLAALPESDDVAFAGLMTVGNRRDPGVTLQGRVYCQAGEILVICEYDVRELARLNNELATVNREVSNLQRALLQEKRRLEETLVKLRQTQAMLIHAAKMNSLGQLVAGVAHEINNPLAFVSGNLHTLNSFLADLKDGFQALRNLIDEAGPVALQARAAEIQQRHDVDYIVHEFADVHRACVDGVGRVKKIVEDLRTFSRLDEAELKTIDLAESLDSTLALARPELNRRQIDVQVDLARLPPVTCFASELNQVFLNLIVNAVQAMQPGGILQIRGRSEGESIRLDFTDNGHGIPPEIQGKIFDPFFTTKPVGQGTGLGLSLAYQIVTERHHGTIQVVSEVNQGTTFSISIPTHVRPE